jgi:hypothetical protein
MRQLGVWKQGSLSALMLACAVVTVGCATSRSPNAAAVAWSLEAAQPGCGLIRESRFALSGLGLAAVRTLVRLAGDDDEATEVLRHLSRVEVATYRVESGATCAGVDSLGGVAQELTRGGWWPMAVERCSSGASWVFARGGSNGALNGLYVIERDGDELEVVRLEGRIDRVIAEAVRDEPNVLSQDIIPALQLVKPVS